MSGANAASVRIGARTFELELEPDVDATDLYWNMLWPASIGLGTYFVETLAECLGGARVLELGCGAGLAGLVAADLGARVTATDIAPEALALTSRNAAANGLEVETAVVDWCAPPVLEPFPIVIGADILYFESLAEPLVNTIDRALAIDGQVYLSDAIRSPFNALLDAFRKRGFEHRQELLEVEANGRTTRIGIYHVRRRRRS